MNCGGHFDISKKKTRLKEVENLEAMDGFWNDMEHVSKIQKEKAILLKVVKSYQTLQDYYDEYELHLECFEGDDQTLAEINTLCEQFEKSYQDMEQQLLLSGELDPNNAILAINAGAGGTESCDWAAMLYRMFIRWAESKGFKVVTLDHQAGDSVGIKSISFTISGAYAYGLLKSEIGIHRLVRISPFDSSARRHTTFASVYVSAEIDDDIEIEVKDKDLRIDVYRSSGAGGQSVNTTDSAVRMTHLPTGTVVTCQNERSQVQNKLQAMKVLKSRLYDLELQKKREKAALEEAGKKEIGWGSQIRSYVLHPYKMVKDHRTNFESGNPEKILDGDLDIFMDSYLRWNSQQSLSSTNEDE